MADRSTSIETPVDTGRDDVGWFTKGASHSKECAHSWWGCNRVCLDSRRFGKGALLIGDLATRAAKAAGGPTDDRGTGAAVVAVGGDHDGFVSVGDQSGSENPEPFAVDAVVVRDEHSCRLFGHGRRYSSSGSVPARSLALSLTVRAPIAPPALRFRARSAPACSGVQPSTM